MTNVVALLARVKAFIKKYPALGAALVNFGVFAAGYFGLNINGDVLVTVVGVLDALFGVAVHTQVTPVAKLAPVPPAPKTLLSPVELETPAEPAEPVSEPAEEPKVADPAPAAPAPEATPPAAPAGGAEHPVQPPVTPPSEVK